MKPLIYLLLITPFVFSCDQDEISSVQSDSFIKYYGSRLKDTGYDVKQLPGGGYVVAGVLSVSDSGTNICLFFTDEFGNSTGEIKTYGDIYDDKVSKIVLLPGGEIAAIGTIQIDRSGNKDIFVMKTDGEGNQIWKKQFGDYNNDEGNSIILDEDGNLVLAGYTEKTGSSTDRDIWLHKIDPDGNPVWGNQRILRNEGDNEALDVVSTPDGYVILGSSIGGFDQFTNEEYYSIFVYKTNKQGIFPSNFTFITDNESYRASSLKILPDGNFMVLGTADNSSGKTDILLAKITEDLSVNTGWPRFINFNGSVSGNSLLVSENRLHIIGTNVLSTGISSILLVITDLNGEMVRSQQFNLLKETEGSGIDFTSDGGYIITGGSTKSDNLQSEILLVKTKADGIL